MKENRRKNGKKADFLLKKRFLQGLAGTKNIGKYHKSGLFAEKQNGIGWRHVTDCDRNSGGKHRNRTKGGNAASEDRTARDRTDDSGSFARRDAKMRKGKEHLIN